MSLQVLRKRKPFVTCEIKFLTSGNTTNLTNHLESNNDKKHTELTETRESEKSAKRQKQQESATKQLMLQSSKQRTHGYGKSLCHASFDRTLVNMLVADFQPASIVEDEGFARFLKVIDERYQPPSCRTFMRDHLP
uniref:BED-type domain-containing protein n=1 Tax=Amphimedon queenslandica TaxID=400682 RepID=A0A1X7V7Q1_AMPQE